MGLTYPTLLDGLVMIANEVSLSLADPDEPVSGESFLFRGPWGGGATPTPLFTKMSGWS